MKRSRKLAAVVDAAPLEWPTIDESFLVRTEQLKQAWELYDDIDSRVYSLLLFLDEIHADGDAPDEDDWGHEYWGQARRYLRDAGLTDYMKWPDWCFPEIERVEPHARERKGGVVEYSEFLTGKVVRVEQVGLEVIPELSPLLFAFQRETVEWALRLGRAAILFDCGLGKSFMQVAWANAVANATGMPVLILAPLAVAHQTIREGAKLDLAVHYCEDGSQVQPGVNITNYERLDKFDPKVFGGVVLDESSILKNFSGILKNAIMKAFKGTRFKLACTATPAPNDHMELGNHAEFLEVMSSSEMLTRWFINDTSLFGNYKLKGHAVRDFWDWVTSWARCAGKPSDVGYSDDGFILPALNTHEHVIELGGAFDWNEVFRAPIMNATAVHQEKRRTASQRARALSELVLSEPNEQWLLWADTDYEADAIVDVLPGAVNVKGSDKQSKKEAALMGFADGEVPILITKAKIAGFGLNFQRCARVAFIGPSFSYESFYQQVRRVWRFGQKRAVEAHMFMGPNERHIWRVCLDKAAEHERMKVSMFDAAKRSLETKSPLEAYVANEPMRLPAWLRAS